MSALSAFRPSTATTTTTTTGKLLLLATTRSQTKISLSSVIKKVHTSACLAARPNKAPIATVSSQVNKLADYLDEDRLLQKYTTHGTLNRKPQIDQVTKQEIKFYDPPYLAREAPFPNYELLDINLKGYDYAVLDSCHSACTKMCKLFKLDIKESYAMPARQFKVKTLQPFSANLDREYELNTYHRVTRIRDLKSTQAPLLFESIQLNLPEGVQLSVSVPTQEDDEFRYVPDIELTELRDKLAELQPNKGPQK